MAAETLPTRVPAAKGGRARLAALWDDRPAWARDSAVLALGASLLVLLVTFFSALGYLSADRPGQHLTLDQLNRLAAAKQIATLELRDQDAVAVGKTRRGTEFSVSYPSSDAVTG